MYYGKIKPKITAWTNFHSSRGNNIFFCFFYRWAIFENDCVVTLVVDHILFRAVAHNLGFLPEVVGSRPFDFVPGKFKPEFIF